MRLIFHGNIYTEDELVWVMGKSWNRRLPSDWERRWRREVVRLALGTFEHKYRRRPDIDILTDYRLMSEHIRDAIARLADRSERWPIGVVDFVAWKWRQSCSAGQTVSG